MLHHRRMTSWGDFYPRPPRGGRLYAVKDTTDLANSISIHALREEGDLIQSRLDETKIEFLSTPSARRATSRPPWCRCSAGYFYPRPPRGGRPKTTTAAKTQQPISIHALREEGDDTHQIDVACVMHFYPRPPRGGRLTPTSRRLARS